MAKHNTAKMDFDAWSAMARSDPEAFESMRLAAIEAAIASAPAAKRERLRRLQWRIDQERRRSRTPLAACIRISRMMWRQVLGPGGLNDRLDDLRRVVHGRPARAATDRALGGQVLAFARRRD